MTGRFVGGDKVKHLTITATFGSGTSKYVLIQTFTLTIAKG